MKTAIHFIAVAMYIAIVGVSIFGVIRGFTALFSKRVRESIVRHPIAHTIWFMIAAVVLYDLLYTCWATKFLPLNPRAALHAGYAPELALGAFCSGASESDC